jgi:NAD(P)-dependent dehydrogenase (short-subunit alcohol dehydrogenase family)
MTFERLNDLDGKVAVIMGGMGQVGYATAIRLAEQKCRIIALVRNNLDTAEQRIKELPNQELNHIVMYADILDSTSLSNAASKITQCDILVNAAGVTKSIPPANLKELTDDIFDNIVTSNLRGAFALIREFSDLLKQSGDGLIVNISSAAAQNANPYSNVAYSSSKAGLNHLTKTLAKALAPTIRIISIVPGIMEKETSGATKPKEFNDMAARWAPLKRIGYGDDVASTIEAYATHIRFATGCIVVIDGGRTI